MPLSSYGLREWLTITIVCIVIAGITALLHWWWLLPVIVILWLALVAFFRDPIRRRPANLDPGDLLSPADGTVWSVHEVDHHESTAGPAVVIRIFLSVLNVHINRSPFDGQVVALKYTPGQFHDARSDECATVNESNLVTLRIAPPLDGWEPCTIGVRQVSGKLARRIVCPLRVGDTLARGQKFGMIKFGSSTELILPNPLHVALHVARGNKVRAGKTRIASLRPH
jgi:phosphatidylserine decarboxylase